MLSAISLHASLPRTQNVRTSPVLTNNRKPVETAVDLKDIPAFEYSSFSDGRIEIRPTGRCLDIYA